MKTVFFLLGVLLTTGTFFALQHGNLVEPTHVEGEEYDVDSTTPAVETFSWTTERINVGRFACPMVVNDTMRIPLIDSQRGRFFVNPHFGRVTSRFGRRWGRWHHGIDIGGRSGDTVCVAFDGIVRIARYDPNGFGNVVVVRHHNGLETLYAHLNRVSVRLNQSVKAGDVVGFVGSTGRSTGPHLHFETRYMGVPFNPEYIIDFRNPQNLRSDILVLTRGNFAHLPTSANQQRVAAQPPQQQRRTKPRVEQRQQRESKTKEQRAQQQPPVLPPQAEIQAAPIADVDTLSTTAQTASTEIINETPRQRFERERMEERAIFAARQDSVRRAFEERDRIARERFESQNREARERLEAQNR